MIRKLLQNTRKPQGVLGRMMLRGMNGGHSSLSAWGLDHLAGQRYMRILDVGCGGGANIAAMLQCWPEAFVEGIDYSEQSVRFSQKTNAAMLERRCRIQQGDVMALPYVAETFELVTAFETVYFWPDLQVAFGNIKRILKPGGTFLICCESEDAQDTTWTSRIDGMTVYTGTDLSGKLADAGFSDIASFTHPKGWVCLLAKA